MANPEKNECRELLQQAKARSGAALGQLLQWYAAYLYYVLRSQHAAELRRLRGKADDSDLIQDVLTTAIQDFDSFKGNTEGEFLAWLCRILKHRLDNFIRAYCATAKRDVGREVPLEATVVLAQFTVPPSSSCAAPEAEAARAENCDIVHQALDKLPPHYRQVITLRHWEKCSFPEIAQVIDLSSPGAARALFTRAMKRAREELGQLARPPG